MVVVVGGVGDVVGGCGCGFRRRGAHQERRSGEERGERETPLVNLAEAAPQWWDAFASSWGGVRSSILVTKHHTASDVVRILMPSTAESIDSRFPSAQPRRISPVVVEREEGGVLCCATQRVGHLAPFGDALLALRRRRPGLC